MPLKAPDDFIKIGPSTKSDGTGPLQVFMPNGDKIPAVMSVSIETITNGWARATIVVMVDVTKFKENDKERIHSETHQENVIV